ncbi:HNH endonuclease [Ectopseudomonas mendocina]|uniref:HNH endonuclease n=1 Tax=Ectopseudomonas mendocina TaxID=300 RepID=A0ABD7S302_ECTME|nr:HNH endonuclease [Pseudomonas mendocina]TRO17238.1 HNH endonuclease [Pseudomonas mendocina]TRO21260.1 HNH endonuclease [Pseudomonas mendocina]
MRCLFCKMDSNDSRSVEHIVPESLWNTKHILPKGIVCDGCNNYFAREVEKPFLDSPSITTLRFTQVIPNKRGRIPPIQALLMPGFPAVAYRTTSDPYRLSLDVPLAALDHIANNLTGTLLLPTTGLPPSDRVVSRFLAKMALEAMALQLLEHPEGLAYLVEEPLLDPIRKFARRGQPSDWPHHARRIYKADRELATLDGGSYQTVHEFDFLVTPQQEWYFIFALFGLELAINIGGPEIDGYVDWLSENNGASPLYFGKNAQ